MAQETISLHVHSGVHPFFKFFTIISIAIQSHYVLQILLALFYRTHCSVILEYTFNFDFQQTFNHGQPHSSSHLINDQEECVPIGSTNVLALLMDVSAKMHVRRPRRMSMREDIRVSHGFVHPVTDTNIHLRACCT